jgi:hypothetical protein
MAELILEMCFQMFRGQFFICHYIFNNPVYEIDGSITCETQCVGDSGIFEIVENYYRHVRNYSF